MKKTKFRISSENNCSLVKILSGIIFICFSSILLSEVCYAQITDGGYSIGAPEAPSSIVCPTCPNNDCSGATSGISFGGEVRPDAFFQKPTISGVAGLCSGQSATLVANGGYLSYVWSDGINILGTAQSIAINPLQTTTYTVTITNGNGCTATSSSLVTVHDNPLLSASASSSVICSGTPLTLTALSNTTSTGPQVLPLGYCPAPHYGSGQCITQVSFGSINNSSPSACSLPSYISYSSGPGTITDVERNTTYILTVSLSSSGYTHAWFDWDRNGVYDPVTEFYNLVNGATNATVAITIPNTAVLGVTSMRIRSRALPSSNDACAAYGTGETEDYPINIISIDQDPNVTYSWNPGALNGSTVNVSPPSSTLYLVTATNVQTGCSSTATIPVNVINASPNSVISATPNPACINGTTTLTVLNPPGGVNYFWENSPNGSPPSWTPLGTGQTIQSNILTFPNNFFRVTAACGISPPVTSFPIIVNATPCLGQTLYVKMFIEGYYSGGGIMNNVVNAPLGGLLYHQGITTDPTDVDYVTLSAMDANPPYSLVESKTGIIKNDGKMHVDFSHAIMANVPYYIRVSHRNSIETWSAEPVVISLTSVLNPYDFTFATNRAYGNNLAELGDGNYGLFSGDISSAASALVGDQDGIIESQDYSDMENAVYLTLLGYVTEDITGDGIVESSDYGIIEGNVFFSRVVIRP